MLKTIKKGIFVLGLIICACNNESSPEKSFLLTELPATKTNINFKNQLIEDINHSIINYIYFYNGSGVAAGDINNDGLTDLYFVSNMGKNKLYLNKGNLKFEDISEKANIEGKSSWNTGVTMVDINNDGLLDIYVCAVSDLLDFKGQNELFINNGDGTFTEKAKDYGLDFKGYATQSYFFDFDKDGDLDVYIVNHAVHTALSYGESNVRYKRVPKVGDVLLENNNGKFVDASEKAGIFGGANGYGLSATIADFNGDNWDDIYVCNDFHEDDYYYINNQDGTFRDMLAENFSTISRFSMGSDAADLNGDGFQDLITLDMLPKNERILKETEGDDAMLNMYARLNKLGYKDQYSRNMLQINNHGNYFHESALLNKIADTDWSWGPLIADFNNDGNQDLFISNGIIRRPNDLDFKMYVSNAFRNKANNDPIKTLYASLEAMPKGDVPNEIFQGNSKTFTNKTGDWIDSNPTCSNGALYSDLDNDGDLDIVLNNLNSQATIFENTTNASKNYITLKLKYKNANLSGIGSKAVVYSNNKKQLKQLFKSRGFLSSTDDKLHFGLDTINKIDSIEILWPNNKTALVKNPVTNQTLVIDYDKNNINRNVTFKNEDSILFEKSNIIDFVHQEDNYNDFFYQKLIPYKVSTQGPAIAIADIDKNGYQDIFIGNSSGKKPELLMNTGTNFVSKTQKALNNDAMFEDNAATFIDIDNDNDLDLYVGSGINTSRKKEYENDCLYINNNGIFKKSEGDIPDNFLNTSCLAAYDYDDDGDDDLFVGNLSHTNYFGANVESYILNNNGKGQFTKDSNFKLSSQVTSATWKDINNDGRKDLLVSAQWDTPKIYINNNGMLELIELPDQINGLWETIQSFDIDDDGDEDILLGNWGLNTKLFASKDKPLHLYYNDFDDNGDYETILAYNKNGLYFPVHSKDELASQMNVINTRFKQHKDYANNTVAQIVSDVYLKNAKTYEVHTLASGYIENNNGNFNNFIPFDNDLQLAPINSFSEIMFQNKKQLIVSGNSKKVNTYHGAYTSLKGSLISTNNKSTPLSKLGMKPFNNQIKRVETIEMKDINLLLVIQNNDSLVSYSYNK
jgi:hypothetical protein